MSVQDELRNTIYATRTNLALAAFEANDRGRFRTLLEQCKPRGDEPDLRGWEWDYLNGLSHEERLTFRDHDQAVYQVASRDDTVRVWDVATGALRLAFKGHGDQVLGAAYSPDARTVASVDRDGLLILWDSRSGGIRRRASTENPLLCVALSRDGHTVIARDSVGRVWW